MKANSAIEEDRPPPVEELSEQIAIHKPDLAIATPVRIAIV